LSISGEGRKEGTGRDRKGRRKGRDEGTKKIGCHMRKGREGRRGEEGKKGMKG
jgi:hypothetical protein